MNDPAAEKQRLRAAMQERLRTMTSAQREAESRSICRRVMEMLPKDARVICSYWPMQTEVDLRPLHTLLLERGAALYLPRTEGRLFTFRRLHSGDTLAIGPFGVAEPAADAEELQPSQAQFVLVPGLAFDRQGHRLGRGNGGYDRWLGLLRTAAPTVCAIGVCFDCQLLHTIVTEPHDATLEHIITPRGTYTAKST